MFQATKFESFRSFKTSKNEEEIERYPLDFKVQVLARSINTTNLPQPTLKQRFYENSMGIHRKMKDKIRTKSILQ